MPDAAEATVRGLLRSREFPSEQSLAEVLDCLAEDAVLHFVPLEPVRGKAAIEAVLRNISQGWGKLDIEIKSLASRGTTVIAEHLEQGGA
jgi:limonene-1,2-epoxide hydrolase